MKGFMAFGVVPPVTDMFLAKWLEEELLAKVPMM